MLETGFWILVGAIVAFVIGLLVMNVILWWAKRHQ